MNLIRSPIRLIFNMFNLSNCLSHYEYTFLVTILYRLYTHNMNSHLLSATTMKLWKFKWNFALAKTCLKLNYWLIKFVCFFNENTLVVHRRWRTIIEFHQFEEKEQRNFCVKIIATNDWSIRSDRVILGILIVSLAHSTSLSYRSNTFMVRVRLKWTQLLVGRSSNFFVIALQSNILIKQRWW